MNLPKQSLSLLAITLGVSFLSQCTPYDANGTTLGDGGGTQYLAGYGPQNQQNQRPGYQDQGYWDGDGVQGSAKIRINRREQKAYFYKGNTLVGVTPISSGDSAHTTPAGHFRVTEKDIDHESSAYGVIKDIATGEIVNSNADFRKDKVKAGQVAVHAPMPNFLRFNHGIGMHTGFLPGYPASHGCVRLPNNMAQHFYQNAQVGTPVIVE